jgi:hypothetical protein
MIWMIQWNLICFFHFMFISFILLCAKSFLRIEFCFSRTEDFWIFTAKSKSSRLHTTDTINRSMPTSSVVFSPIISFHFMCSPHAVSPAPVFCWLFFFFTSNGKWLTNVTVGKILDNSLLNVPPTRKNRRRKKIESLAFDTRPLWILSFYPFRLEHNWWKLLASYAKNLEYLKKTWRKCM